MTDETQSRREMLATSARAVSAGWLALHLPLLGALAACARDDAKRNAPLTTLSADEGRTFAAFAAQIFPSGELPGASEAGVVHFVDRALPAYFPQMEDVVRKGIADLDQRARGSGAGATRGFADLPEARQIEIVKEIEKSDFFGAGRMLTVLGMFSDPSYGGNRDEVGLKLLQIEHQATYQPPFGYYDAEAAPQRAGGAS